VAPLFDVFTKYGGFWIALLSAVTWIAYARLSAVQDVPTRWVQALSQPWVMKTAVLLSLLAWLWSFGRLYFGKAYLRGADTVAELSTILLVLILLLAGLAWRSIRPNFRFHPWLTYALALGLILSSGPLQADAPKKNLSQRSGDDERPAIAYLQGRLAQLDCFKAAGEPARRSGDGSFEALTASAVIAFQMANNMVKDPKLDDPGVVHPNQEFRLLARPFPFLLGPKRCQVAPEPARH
jgi:hypothetical protein